MDASFYDMIFKRRSFHTFLGAKSGSISDAEIETVKSAYKTLAPLCSDIATDIRIIPAGNPLVGCGEEYRILFYSEQKENALANIGYIGEQMDLLLASMGIGALWYGMGKPDEKIYHGLDYMIMICIAKVKPDRFRSGLSKVSREPLEKLWHGETIPNVSDIARFAPSAVNSQPWLVEHKDGELRVYRYEWHGRFTSRIIHYNRMDIGIFLCFLELCLEHEGAVYGRTLYPDGGGTDEKTLVAVYLLK